MPPASTNKTITVERLDQRRFAVTLIGETGMFHERMSAKAKRQLMLGGRKKTAAEKLEIKHDPYAEFTESMYLDKDAHEHSHVFFPAMGFKAAMADAAKYVPGITMTDAKRLLYFPTEMVPIFGIPTLRMDVVRSADMNRTPDVRTRAYFPEWGTQFEIEFTSPQLTQESVVNMLENAGRTVGVGGFRQGKGKGGYGTFRVAEPHEIEHMLDRDAQWRAIEAPEAANVDSMELLEAFADEVERRS